MLFYINSLNFSKIKLSFNLLALKNESAWFTDAISIGNACVIFNLCVFLVCLKFLYIAWVIGAVNFIIHSVNLCQNDSSVHVPFGPKDL